VTIRPLQPTRMVREVSLTVHAVTRNGRFTMPDLTAEQMQEGVKGKLKEFGMPGFVAGFFTRKIPTLERWKSKAAS